MEREFGKATNYFSRFGNHVSTILYEPHSTIDEPFRNDVQNREARPLSFTVDVDKAQFRVNEPNLFTQHSDKEFRVYKAFKRED